MVTMTAIDRFRLPHGRSLTVRDLEGVPDDGNRYELIDGQLVVSPAPGFPHQRVVRELTVRLHTRCPDGFEVLPAPFAARPDDANEPGPPSPSTSWTPRGGIARRWSSRARRR